MVIRAVGQPAQNISKRWASSAGPLLVRTLWTGTHHHAILTKDDPMLIRPLQLRPKTNEKCIKRSNLRTGK